jgi:flagellar protein FliJ
MTVKKQFEMQQVLNYRTELEKISKLDFASAKQDLDSATDLLEKEKTETNQIAEEFSGRQQHINSIFEMQLYADFFVRKREELKEQQLRIEALDRVLEDRRLDLMQATKEKKVLEQLKDKQKAAFRREIAHKEGLLLDEISTQKKGRE